MRILIFLLCSTTSVILGQIWQPLHLDYRYQTYGIYYTGYGYYGYCNDYSINKDTIINGREYFYYNQLPRGLNSVPVRYDTQTHLIQLPE